jgi:hypothetical protein
MSLIKMCWLSRKKVVLIIDEVDSATNNQVFIDFLAQIIKQKIRPDAEHKTNNPLFQSLTGKLSDDPMLRTVLYELLFTGKTIPYVA